MRITVIGFWHRSRESRVHCTSKIFVPLNGRGNFAGDAPLDEYDVCEEVFKNIHD